MDFKQDIMWESLYAAILPVFDTLTLPAMQAFDVVITQGHAGAAIKGAVAAMIIWLAVGRVFRIAQEKVQITSIDETIAKAPQHTLSWFLPLALCVSFLPIGFAAAFAAGFFRTSLLTCFPAILFAQAGYYYYIIAG